MQVTRVSDRCGAIRRRLRRHWKDLRDNPRYAKYGLMSALLTGCIMVYYHYPIPAMDLSTFVWLYTHPGMVALDTLVFGGGFTLAIALGVVGIVRPARWYRFLGLVGILVSANYLYEHQTTVSLWESMWSLFQFGLVLAIAIPASAAFELSGQNEMLALVLYLVPAVLVWLASRKQVLGALESRASSRSAFAEHGGT